MSPESEELEKPREPKRVSVVIVSLNRPEALRESLEMLGDQHHVVVVDNGSSTPGIEATMRLPKNFGLTKALNIGLRAAEGEYILCLHDDARLSGDSVTKLADYLEAHPEAGMVCPLLTDQAGKPAPQVCALPSAADPEPAMVPASGGEEITAACVSGAAFMFRGIFLRALRQVEERYGTYGSNLEFSAQMKRAAKKIVILRDVPAVHEGSVSTVKASSLESDRVAGTIAFLAKHCGLASSIAYRLKAGPKGLMARKIDGN